MNEISPQPEQPTPAASAPMPQPKAARRWTRYVLYTLAFFGVLLIALVVSMIVTDRMQPKRVTINETEVIDSVMSRTYGKYSEQHKGWLFVGEGNRNYVMRVIQQAKPKDGAKGEELYFVASGTPLDGEEGGLYGVFQVRAGDKSDGDSLVEVSSSYRYEGAVPVTPDKVHFEALSESVWAWVIKVQDGADPKQSRVLINNVVLAPHGDDIALLGTFKASMERDPGIDCAVANERYEAWAKPPAAADAASVESSGPDQVEMPPRCSKSRWSYRTAAVSGTTPVPLLITGKGVEEGVNVDDKTFKVVFDSQSFTYTVPEELIVDYED